MAKRRRQAGKIPKPPKAETYRHPEADSPLRPDVGTQAQFKKKKPPASSGGFASMTCATPTPAWPFSAGFPSWW